MLSDYIYVLGVLYLFGGLYGGDSSRSLAYMITGVLLLVSSTCMDLIYRRYNRGRRSDHAIQERKTTPVPFCQLSTDRKEVGEAVWFKATPPKT